MAVELTNKEAIEIIRVLGQIEGVLSVNDENLGGGDIASWLDWPIDLLIERMVTDES